ncbi:MAG: hypothetical protein KAX38_02260, partial [Candidatus Krumholzibacteria bacterium]|nr:hypothetical protein [Candidatus Krumholzibacteria bacterium]
MRPATVPAFVLIFLIVHGSAPAEPGKFKTSVSPRREVIESRTFILEEGQSRLDLGRPFIIPESDSVTVDGRALRRGDDYRINTLRGSIILVIPAVGGERLVARFSRYPFSFSPAFASRFPGGKPSLPLAVVSPVRSGKRERRREDPYRLRLSGSKTVGISIGSNKDLSLDQSLRVTMMGKVAKDLEVKAFLSDDNLPVQPEGNTEELKHLEKVFVEVRSKHSEVQLGDFTTGLKWSRFAAFQRELRGASARVGVGDQTFFAGGGIAKGRFKTMSFFGREGVQGPYELLPARRFNGVIILPGTEMVYLDGRLLKRGSENEYTIDYNRGTVTFTERTAINDDSEIVIDFQIGEDDYERSTVTAGWTSRSFGDALCLRAFFFQESDDSGRPVRGGLSDQEMSRLRAAGDDPDSAMTEGVELVEEGKGSYILLPADSLPERFAFVESGGKYILDFHEVGYGKGNYKSDGFTARGEVKYAYAGEEKGDYVIGRPLSLPERKRVFTLGVSTEQGHLFLDAEGDLSLYDRNTLSEKDDDDNTGGAVKIEGGIKELPISSTVLSVTGEFSTLEDRFASPDVPREAYFYRNWNLENVPLEGRENIAGAALRWQKEAAWDIQSSYRFLSRGPDLSARKCEVAASVGDMRSTGLNVKALDSRTGNERDRKFARGEGVLSFWHLV